jgi:hypothetical protein
METSNHAGKSKKKPVYKKWWFWVIAVFLLFVVGSALDQPETATPNNQETSQQSIFDTPSLFGKNIDEIRAVLGDPADKDSMDMTKEQLASGSSEWWNSWEKGQYTLTIAFHPTTRVVKDFFIGATTSAEEKDSYLLLPVANLSKTNSKYTIKPVKQIKNPSLYTGIIITPR